MRFSISTMLWALLTIGLLLGLYVALNRPKQVLIRNERGWRHFEFEDSIKGFNFLLEDHTDLKPVDFPKIIALASQICSDLEKVKNDTGFYEWEIVFASYETISGIENFAHGYSITIEGEEFPARIGINKVATIELFFISKQLVLYSSEGSVDNLSKFLPDYEWIIDATPESPNPKSGGFF